MWDNAMQWMQLMNNSIHKYYYSSRLRFLLAPLPPAAAAALSDTPLLSTGISLPNLFFSRLITFFLLRSTALFLSLPDFISSNLFTNTFSFSSDLFKKYGLSFFPSRNNCFSFRLCSARISLSRRLSSMLRMRSLKDLIARCRDSFCDGSFVLASCCFSCESSECRYVSRKA